MFWIIFHFVNNIYFFQYCQLLPFSSHNEGITIDTSEITHQRNIVNKIYYMRKTQIEQKTKSELDKYVKPHPVTVAFVVVIVNLLGCNTFESLEHVISV
jgi:hypothetical protein